tara:strand:- start:1119 stop:1232 length:114 start_codon:yes stop_codon:yes gene_type:complete
MRKVKTSRKIRFLVACAVAFSMILGIFAKEESEKESN